MMSKQDMNYKCRGYCFCYLYHLINTKGITHFCQNVESLLQGVKFKGDKVVWSLKYLQALKKKHSFLHQIAICQFGE